MISTSLKRRRSSVPLDVENECISVIAGSRRTLRTADIPRSSRPSFRNTLIWIGALTLALLVISINNAVNIYQSQNGMPNIDIGSRSRSTYKRTSERSESEPVRYLYYFNHAGWSNQLIALYHAAQLAHHTNRTLIVPPILSHHTSNDIGNAREANSKRLFCGPDHLNLIKSDAAECKKTPKKSSHVRFSEIIDMKKLSQDIHVSFTDLCDFVKMEPTLTKKYFFEMKHMKPKQRENDLSGLCSLGHLRSYEEMIGNFQSIYAKDDIAILPSAFILNNSNTQTKHFMDNVLGFPPSSNLSEFINILKNRISTNYIGIHLRYQDSADNNNANKEFRFKCSEDNKISVFHNLVGMKNVSHVSAASTSISVFLASNSRKAVKCYKQFLVDKGIQVFTLEDLFAQEQNHATKLSSGIKTTKSTIYLILDQILVSMGKQILLVNKMKHLDSFAGEDAYGSTFQWVIKTRHEASKLE